MRPLRIGVIGSGSATAREAGLAHAVGVAVARAGAVVVCGGMGGVMQAAADGAASEGGTVVGILPGGDPAQAAGGVTIPIPTGLGEARNVLVARASEAVVAIAGEWGTLSEAAFCRKFGIPVVGLASTLPERVLDEIVGGAAEAAARALELAAERRRALA
ncbi:TIGR00725 family protein [Candidatus Palauibacter sp.]|uniref:SLOG cluster 4 domain-containing protein n=1 Tax=Candidatus Palauibacter sp. TaxID=3101350 RepID=UPI003AF2E596